MNVAKLTSKFQITIPADIRCRLGLHQGDSVVIDLEGDKAVLRPVRGGHVNRMSGLGKDVWAKLGGGDAYLQSEQDSWDQE